MKDILSHWVTEYDTRWLIRMTSYERESYINKYWGLIEQSGALDVDGITVEQKANIKKAWPSALCMLIPLLCADYNEAGEKYGYSGLSESAVMFGTLLSNMALIPVNHIHSVTLAWARSFDSYYEDAPACGNADCAPVGAPTAAVSQQPLSDSRQTPCIVNPSDTIKLDVPDRSGETIVYTIKNSAGAVLVEDALYTDGVRFPDSVCVGDVCSLTVTVWSHGHTASKAFFCAAAPAISAEEITSRGISYRVDCGGASIGSAQVIAAAYIGGRLVDFSASGLLTGSGTLTGTLPLDTDDGCDYRLFLVAGDTNRPMCPCWRSEEAV